MNKDLNEVKSSTAFTEHYYQQHAKVVRKLDKKLADKLVKISEAAKDASEYIKSREA